MALRVKQTPLSPASINRLSGWFPVSHASKTGRICESSSETSEVEGFSDALDGLRLTSNFFSHFVPRRKLVGDSRSLYHFGIDRIVIVRSRFGAG